MHTLDEKALPTALPSAYPNQNICAFNGNIGDSWWLIKRIDPGVYPFIKIYPDIVHGTSVTQRAIKVLLPGSSDYPRLNICMITFQSH